MATIETLNDGLKEEIRDLYSAETQILKALPKIIKNATNEELKRGLEQHRIETEQHVTRLEEIGKHLELNKLSGKTCQGMKGLLMEGEETMKESYGCDGVKDARIIGACQRVEHYEISAYGTVRTMAETLGLTEVVQLLEETLNEEKTADENLTTVAEKEVLQNCTTEGDEGEPEDDDQSMDEKSGSRGAKTSKRGSSTMGIR